MSRPVPETLFVGTGEVASLMRSTDWARTPVGAATSWPQSVRALLRMMLTSRYAMWMGWGADLRFFYNDAYAAMTLGAKHPWALGRPASEVWAEIWSDIGPRIDHVLTTGEATWDEGLLLFLERSGFPEETYHTFSYSPLHDDDGRIAGMFCVVTEETERVIGERRLAALRDLGARLAASQTTDDVWRAVEHALLEDPRDFPFTLTYLLEGDDECVLVARTNVDAGDPVAAANCSAHDVVWPIQEVAASGTPTVIDLDPARVWPAGPWQKAPSRAIVLPIPRQGQAGPAGVFIAGLNPYRPLDAAFESFIGLFVAQVAAGFANAQAYLAEKQRAEALAQIDRAKTTFFSNISHELRTPLTLILGPIADALAAPQPALAGEALEMAYRNGLRLRKLVNGLLDFSRIEAGRVDANYEPVDLGAYTAHLASAFRSTLERAGLRLVVRTDETAPPAYVDRDMWEKVVLNLISNAFKFTFEGEIEVSVTRDGEEMLLAVRDTGTGIPAEELPRIFERFHRVEGARGRTHEGTGIGLSLVQELVKLHGGSIGVTSEPGRGTTFSVRIPLGSAHLPAERINADRQLSTTSLGVDAVVSEALRWLPGAPETAAAPFDTGPPAGASASAARIVLADDNADMRTYLVNLLGGRWEVAVAADGAAALALVREAPTDLVITDVMMPTLDGFGLLRELRAAEDTRHIPVLMLSARAGEEARLEGFQAGASDYLAKPFTARELVARVEAQILRSRMRSIEDTNRRRLAEVFEQAPVAIAILRGPDHVFELANPPYLEFVHQREIVGLPVRQAMPELAGQGLYELLDSVYQSGQRYVGQSRLVRLARGAGGTLEDAYFDFVYQPMVDDSGAVDGIAVVAFEVTALAKARQAAEDANRAKDEFLAMLGHELRNPLAPILTALQLLRLRGVEAGERERTIIERQVRHLVGLVDDLLDVSRITRGKIRLTREPVEISQVVAKAIEQSSPLLEQHQHDLETLVPRQGLVVLADPARLAQVVSNLLTNAAKYSPPGGQIVMTARAEGDDVLLSVRDRGIGIDPEMLPRIFDLFTQDRQAIDRAQGGLGLGLSIVRSFVTLHGGTVTAHSEGRGRGSEFVIRLPRHAASAAATADGEAAPAAAVPAPAGARVLVVDDNEDAALMLAEALSASGHDTAVAHDGPSALHTAATFRPDIGLLDIGLPVMDGYELARQFRAREGLARVRLVAVTGYGQEHDRRRSADAGFDAHLVKPVDLDEVIRLVQQFGGGPRSAS